MPIGAFEREVLRVIAGNRNPDSYLGGATVLHQAATSARASRDLDVFHDTTESLAKSVEIDVAALRKAGFAIQLSKPHTFHSPEQIKQVTLNRPLDLVCLKREWLQIIEESEALVAKLPLNEVGCFYLNAGGNPVCPNPESADFSKLIRHFGSVKGAWPRIADS